MIRYADPLIQDGDEDLFWPLVMMTMYDATHAAMLQQRCMMHAGNGLIRYADPLIQDDDGDLFFWPLVIMAMDDAARAAMPCNAARRACSMQHACW